MHQEYALVYNNKAPEIDSMSLTSKAKQVENHFSTAMSLKK